MIADDSRQRPRILKHAMIVLLVVVALYVGAVGLMFAFQRSLLFMADRTMATPTSAGLFDTDAVSLTTSDGVTISSWLAKAAGSERLVIYFHGNGGSLAYRAPSIYRWTQLGLSVLAVEYRGYGASEGTPSEDGLARDADAACAYARSLGYAPSRIILYGESLGSAVAVALATRASIGGLVLDAPFTSIADVAAARYWMFPVRWLIRDPFHSDRLIGKVSVPIFMMHGTADRVVPYQFGQALHALAGPRATFVTVEGAGHIVLGDPQIWPRLRDWLAKLS